MESLVKIDLAAILADLDNWRSDEDAVVSMIDTFEDMLHYYCEEN